MSLNSISITSPQTYIHPTYHHFFHFPCVYLYIHQFLFTVYYLFFFWPFHFLLPHLLPLIRTISNHSTEVDPCLTFPCFQVITLLLFRRCHLLILLAVYCLLQLPYILQSIEQRLPVLVYYYHTAYHTH